MRILVCGGRKFKDEALFNAKMDEFRVGTAHDDLIIHGGAPGADFLAACYALKHKLPMICFPADWGKYGKAAGYVRNCQMLVEGKPDVVIAFPGGKGTAMMVEIAMKAGVRVLKPL